MSKMMMSPTEGGIHDDSAASTRRKSKPDRTFPTHATTDRWLPTGSSSSSSSWFLTLASPVSVTYPWRRKWGGLMLVFFLIMMIMISSTTAGDETKKKVLVRIVYGPQVAYYYHQIAKLIQEEFWNPSMSDRPDGEEQDSTTTATYSWFQVVGEMVPVQSLAYEVAQQVFFLLYQALRIVQVLGILWMVVGGDRLLRWVGFRRQLPRWYYTLQTHRPGRTLFFLYLLLPFVLPDLTQFVLSRLVQSGPEIQARAELFEIQLLPAPGGRAPLSTQFLGRLPTASEVVDWLTQAGLLPQHRNSESSSSSSSSSAWDDTEL